jgi:hypothetical protein
MQAMPIIQMLLDLDYPLCNSMMLPFKFTPVKRSFGLAPNQLKLSFKQQPTRNKPHMTKLIMICIVFTLFGLGMFTGALMADHEWYRLLTDETFKCSLLDSSKICKAKVKLQKTAQNLNELSVTSDGGSNGK